MVNLFKMFDNSNFIDFIDYTAHEEFSCESYGCYEEGICRCARIQNFFIKDIKISNLVNEIYSRLKENSKLESRDNKLTQLIYDYEPDTINRYCIDRILSVYKIWKAENWFPVISSGYYGEEIEDIIIQRESFEKILSKITEVISIDELDLKIHFLFKLEYGEIIEKLKSKKFSLTKVDYSSIKFPQKSHSNRVESKELSFYSNYNLPKGVLLKNGNNYLVVDGYHRLLANSLLKEVEVIIAE